MEGSQNVDGRPSSADELLAPVRQVFAKLQRSIAVDRGAIDDALRQLTEAAAAALRVDRASIWRFGTDRSEIHCVDLFDRRAGSHSAGATLSASDTPRYFAALERELTISAHDARSDPRTSEFEPGYLVPNGISAMLDAPIWLSGQLVGVLCHEHVGAEPRSWAPWEELVAGTIADYASIILGAAERAAQARALERAAVEHESLLDGVFASAPFGLAFFDRELRYTRINEWLTRVNGRSSETTIGKQPREIIRDPEIARLCEAMVARVFETGEASSVVELSNRRSIPPSTFLVRWYPIAVHGIVDHVGCYVVDVTEQRLHERERVELLERERAARHEAEAANRAKDDFFSVLGHELRNPLAPIVTALELMRPLGALAETERAVIERQVKHLGRLVDDMLDVTRITRGKLELRRSPVELVDVVEKAIEMASPLVDRNGHRLVVDVPSSGLPLHADADRMAQVVSNLLTNAAKFTPAGGRIDVRAERDGDEITLEVRDTGVGVSAELLPRLFDAFFQGERRVARSQGGLGLGLAIVQGIVSAHGGTVSVDSAGIGKGCSFVVRLHARTDERSAASEAAQGSGRPRSMTARRVLVVDDNEDAALMLVTALQASGHEVVAAHDGPTALAAAERFRPDTALLDLGLPVMDGFELAQRLRKLPSARPMTIIAVTGFSSARDRERSAQASFDVHLVKPIDTLALEKLLASLSETG